MCVEHGDGRSMRVENGAVWSTDMGGECVRDTF